MIEMDNVSKWYGPVQVLKNCTLNVAKGEVVVVCGPSGSGKSTLIKTVNALEPFQEGKITVAGVSVNDKKTDLPKLRARIGMVFQHFELFPHLSVKRNLTIAQKRCSAAARQEATGQGRSRFSSASACRLMPTNFPANCPAASSSASPSPARSPWIPSPCCSTSRLPRSIRK